MDRDLFLRMAAAAGLGSALLAVAALVGFLVVVGSGTISEGAVSTGWFFPTGAVLGSTVLLGIAAVGLFLHQEGRLGSLGVAGFVVALVGTMLAAGGQWTYVFVLPYFAEAVPEMLNESSGTVVAGFVLSYATLSLGWLMFGLASRKTGLLPRRGVIVMMVGAAIALIPLPSRTLILSLAVAYLGAHLRKDHDLPQDS